MPQTRPQGIDSRKQRKENEREREKGRERVECLKSQFAVGIANKT